MNNYINEKTEELRRIFGYTTEELSVIGLFLADAVIQSQLDDSIVFDSIEWINSKKDILDETIS